jgi:uncharacterized protein (TIGR02147 family)
MWIIEFSDYKRFLRAVIKTYPKLGRGQLRRLAEHLDVASVVMSHIVSGDRHFNPDQALKVAEFFALDEKTTEYFLYLVNHDRAETRKLREFYLKKLEAMRTEFAQVKAVVQSKDELSEPEKATFYSSWYYSGVRLLSSIEGFQSPQAIGDYFGLSGTKIAEILSFLVNSGLCTQEGGKYRMGAKSTLVTEPNPFLNIHRRNWRDKAIQKFPDAETGDLFFSSPVSISEEDAEIVRKQALEFIKEFSARVRPSPAEKVMCLNIDWFKF